MHSKQDINQKYRKRLFSNYPNVLYNLSPYILKEYSKHKVRVSFLSSNV